MDYAIYKTNDGKHPRVIQRFTQAESNHRAKQAAIEKLYEMWLRVLNHPTLNKNPKGTKEEFSYDYMTSTNTSERIRFYIAKL